MEFEKCFPDFVIVFLSVLNAFIISAIPMRAETIGWRQASIIRRFGGDIVAISRDMLGSSGKQIVVIDLAIDKPFRLTGVFYLCAVERLQCLHRNTDSSGRAASVRSNNKLDGTSMAEGIRIHWLDW